jgi:hypothetical protein
VRQVKIALWTFEAQPVRAERLQVRAAGNEGDVGSGRRETAAEIAADAAAADDRDTKRDHGIILSRVGRVFRRRTIHICPQDADSGQSGGQA